MCRICGAARTSLKATHCARCYTYKWPEPEAGEFVPTYRQARSPSDQSDSSRRSLPPAPTAVDYATSGQRLIAGSVAAGIFGVVAYMTVLTFTCPSEGELGCLALFLGFLFIGIPWMIAGTIYGLVAILPTGGFRRSVLHGGFVVVAVLSGLTLPVAGFGIFTAPLAIGLWFLKSQQPSGKLTGLP